MEDPSVKGSLMLGVVIAVRRHRDGGRIAPEQLEACLGPGALGRLDEKIDISRWYPVADFCELIDADWSLVGGRDPDHARRAGALSADRLFDRGIYQQLDYAERAVRVRDRASLVRQAKLIATVTGSLYNFLEVDVRVDEDASDTLEIVHGNAAPLAEVVRYTTEGFMNQVNHRQGSARRWTSERTRPDVVVYRMPLPSRLVETI